MKVLVTGATGFIGACLARYLVEQGYDVHIFTRMASNTWRIADILNLLTNHEVDLRNQSSVEQAIEDIRPQIIYHLAAHGTVVAQNDANALFESNFIGTVNLLRSCEKVGFDCFVNTGSSLEYGLKSEPMEESDFMSPLGDYGVSKAASTLYCRSEAIGKELPIVTLRLFTTFGPWDDPKRLIPYVIKSFLRGKQPELSTPQSVRDFIFIDDILSAFSAVVKKPFRGDIFNIASGIQHPIGEVVAVIQNIVGTGLRPLWGARAPQRAEPVKCIASIKKAETQIGWRPSMTLRNGLVRTVEWMRNNLDCYP